MRNRPKRHDRKPTRRPNGTSLIVDMRRLLKEIGAGVDFVVRADLRAAMEYKPTRFKVNIGVSLQDFCRYTSLFLL